MTWDDVLATLRAVADEGLAEEWDQVGVHVEPEQSRYQISRILLCIDLTPAVAAEAMEGGFGGIVAYHPPIFSPLERLTGETWKGRVLLDLVRAGIGVYSPHTALDATEGGVCDWLCDGLAGVGSGRRPIRAKPRAAIYKIVTFVPEGSLDAVRGAMAAAGAGTIGRYDTCSFASGGTGTFRGGEGTNPTIGEPGRVEHVQEVRLEMVCEASVVDAALGALRGAHPYEEAAFDVFREEIPQEAATGAGRVVRLAEPVSMGELKRRLCSLLRIERVEVASDDLHRILQDIAICPGAGGSLFEGLSEVDALVTGEMRHHEVLEHVQSGRCVVLAGHTQTERPYLPVYRERLIAAGDGGGGVEWVVSERDRPPGALDQGR